MSVESLILSIQISSDEQPRISLGDETVTMTFNIGNVGYEHILITYQSCKHAANKYAHLD